MSAPTAETRSLFSSLSQYLLPHSWVLAAGAVGAVLVKQPKLAKVLGAVALADVAGRQLSPEWAALVAGWYPKSAEAASAVAPLRTVEEVRARGIKSVNAVAAQPQTVAALSVVCGPGMQWVNRRCEPVRINTSRGAAARVEFLASDQAFSDEPSVANYKRRVSARQEWERVNGSPVSPDPTATELANVGANFQRWKLAKSCPAGTQQKSGGCSTFADGSCPPGMERNTMSWHTLDQSGYPNCVPARGAGSGPFNGLRPPSRAALAGLLMR